jgi:hypothetical protein
MRNYQKPVAKHGHSTSYSNPNNLKRLHARKIRTLRNIIKDIGISGRMQLCATVRTSGIIR